MAGLGHAAGTRVPLTCVGSCPHSSLYCFPVALLNPWELRGGESRDMSVELGSLSLFNSKDNESQKVSPFSEAEYCLPLPAEYTTY